MEKAPPQSSIILHGQGSRLYSSILVIFLKRVKKCAKMPQCRFGKGNKDGFLPAYYRCSGSLNQAKMLCETEHWCLGLVELKKSSFISKEFCLLPPLFRIRIQLGSVPYRYSIRSLDQDSESGPGGQKWQKKKKVQKFNVLRCWMFSFAGWRLLL